MISSKNLSVFSNPIEMTSKCQGSPRIPLQ